MAESKEKNLGSSLFGNSKTLVSEDAAAGFVALNRATHFDGSLWLNQLQQ